MAENENDLLAPENSPGSPEPGKGVRRVNNRPLLLVGLVVVVFLGLIGMEAASRAKESNNIANGGAGQQGTNNSYVYAKSITREYDSGFIPAKVDPLAMPAIDDTLPDASTPEEKAPEPEPATAPPTITVLRPSPENMDAPPLPPSAYQADDDRAETLARIRQAKIQKFEAALMAGTTVDVSDFSAPESAYAGSSSGFGPGSELQQVQERIASLDNRDPTAAYRERLAQIKNGMGGGGDSAANGGGSPNLLQAFAGDTGTAMSSDRWHLDSSLEAPSTPYMLRAGYVIPGVMISGVNSDLPGQIMGQVSQDVYDTPTGKHLLIPAGTRLVGTYESGAAYGQERVMIAWQRLVYPDGRALDIAGMPGADSAGYSGFKDKVNHHFVRIFGSAFLMTGITAGVTLSQGDDDSDDDSMSANDALSQALGQQLGQVAIQMIEKNMNISPTIEIRPGYRFNIMVSKDMAFSKPYRSFDY